MMQKDTDIIDDLLLTADLHEDEANEAELGHGTSLSLLCIRAVGEIRKLRAQVADKPAVAVPAVPEEWRAGLSQLLDTFERCEAGFPPHVELRFAVRDKARALLQSSQAAPSMPEEWREVMMELADDLAIEIDQSYPPERRAYPSEQRRYEGEMAIVNRARALLQSSAAKDSLTTAPLSESERKNLDAAADRLLEGGE